jgi:S-adenosylmethionine synthetase
MELILEPLRAPRGDASAVEVVERKGLGHPDSVCDALAEALSLAYSRHCLERFGRILHHNVDKALLEAGRSAPRFGGGELLAPIELHLAGRACAELGGERIPLEELAAASTRAWLATHLPALAPERALRLHCDVRPGAAELVDLFDRAERTPLANDTSCGCGHAPFSTLEQIVYAVERALSGGAVPGAGADVKVMGVRARDQIRLQVACAARAPALPDRGAYLALREALSARALACAREHTARPVEVQVNSADDDARDVFYLTVTGTSAEMGDDGQAGRGNRANGLITPGRPMTLESVAGKNPTSHVGKLYNVAASLLAEALVREIPELRAAECLLVSRIGHPIDDPPLADLRLDCEAPPGSAPWRRAEALARDHIRAVSGLWRELVEERVALDRWPLRRSPAPTGIRPARAW